MLEWPLGCRVHTTTCNSIHAWVSVKTTTCLIYMPDDLYTVFWGEIGLCEWLQTWSGALTQPVAMYVTWFVSPRGTGLRSGSQGVIGTNGLNSPMHWTVKQRIVRRLSVDMIAESSAELLFPPNSLNGVPCCPHPSPICGLVQPIYYQQWHWSPSSPRQMFGFYNASSPFDGQRFWFTSMRVYPFTLCTCVRASISYKKMRITLLFYMQSSWDLL